MADEKNVASGEEETLEDLAMKAQILDGQAKSLIAQLDQIERAISNLNQTIQTLENFNKLAKKALLPIGNSVYISCKDIDNEVFVAIGADVVVKKTPAEAKEFLEQKVKELDKILEDGRKKLDLINGLITDVNTKAAKLSRMKNVRPSKE
jgi:prefoldin alpha subunit